MPTYALTTLGCKVNQYDGQSLAAALEGHGLRASGGAPADLVVVNSCCVTVAAMHKSRYAIRRALQRSPGAAVLVAGCYSDIDAKSLAGMLAALGVPADKTFIAGHQDNLPGTIRRIARSFAGGAAQDNGDNRAPAGSTGPDATPPAGIKSRRLAAVRKNSAAGDAMPTLSHFAGHQRAFVKVQDGCDALCSYCIVPFARSVVWSRAIPEVLDECRHLIASGHREIVLSGVFLGAYGRPTAVRRNWSGPGTLPELVRRVAALPGLHRLRLSSLEPMDLDDELLDVCRQSPTVARHFHLPLQSGSGRLLERMNRQYTISQYRDMVTRLRQALDRPALTTDIIVGFPGEGDEDFQATLEVARFAGFSRMHAFPFSPIEPTAAWVWRKEAPAASVVKARMQVLAALGRELSETYCRQFVGETTDAIVEKASAAAQATTERYLVAHFTNSKPPARLGEVVHLQVLGLRGDGLLAQRL